MKEDIRLGRLPSPCRAVLFDLDGVVVDSMTHHASAWRRVLAEYGLVVDVGEIYKREGMTGFDSIKDIFIAAKVPVPADDEIRQLMEKKHAIFECHKVSVFPRVDEILSLLMAAGVRLALVTGSLRSTVSQVCPDGILAGFDFVVNADMVTRGKPDPEPYLRALDGLGCPATEAIAIENAPMGIRSAKRAGLLCYALETTLAAPALAEADLVFRDHAALFEFLETFFH